MFIIKNGKLSAQHELEAGFARLTLLTERLVDADSTGVAVSAHMLVNELRTLTRKQIGILDEPERAEVSCADDTNYATYELLATYGLSPQQLIDVARVECLHDLRVLRMLRTVYGLSLEEARQMLVAT